MFAKRHPDYRRFKSLKAGVYTIEGTVGIGKSTLGSSLAHYLNAAEVPAKFFPEYVNKDLLNQYISDMKKYAFPFQLCMLFKRIEIYREAGIFAASGGVAIIDRSMTGDYTFAKMQHANGNITDAEWQIYLSIMKQDIQLEPTLTLWLQCSVETSMARIRKRGIESEINGYSTGYIAQLQEMYEDSFAKSDTMWIELEWGNNVAQENGILAKDFVYETLDLMVKS